MAVTGIDPDNQSVHRIDWVPLTVLAREMADLAAADGMPDVVIGVARGGLVPAVLVSHLLAVRDLRVIDVARTLSDDVDALKASPPRVRLTDSVGDLTELDVLLVDDVAGSGETIDAATDLVWAAGAARVRTAVCVVNEANWLQPRDPAEVLTYIGRRLAGWVSFSWETT
jgi:hypoxanthine phosphoribosyltransferase